MTDAFDPNSWGLPCEGDILRKLLPTSYEHELIFDEVDLNLIDEHRWIVMKTGTGGLYVCRYYGYKKRKKVYLHREIMMIILNRPIPWYMDVDHINNNGLDNRRDNLRELERGKNRSRSNRIIAEQEKYK